MAPPPGACEAVLDCWHKLYETRNYADLTIVCGDTRFLVHKSVVCPQSTFLANACKFEWKEGQSNEVVMNDDDDITPIADPEIVSHLIYYMYHFDYLPATTAHSAEGQSTKRRKTLSDFLNGTPVPEYADPVTHALMYAVADFYGVSGLKYVAREKYAATMKEHVDHPHCADSISIVYSMTPESDRGLRDIVLQHLGSSLNRLADPALNATVREVKGLAFELLEYNFAGNKKSPDPTRFSTESVREWNSVQKGCVKIPPSVQSTMMPRTR